MYSAVEVEIAVEPKDDTIGDRLQEDPEAKGVDNLRLRKENRTTFVCRHCPRMVAVENTDMVDSEVVGGMIVGNSEGLESAGEQRLDDRICPHKQQHGAYLGAALGPSVCPWRQRRIEGEIALCTIVANKTLTSAGVVAARLWSHFWENWSLDLTHQVTTPSYLIYNFTYLLTLIISLTESHSFSINISVLRWSFVCCAPSLVLGVRSSFEHTFACIANVTMRGMNLHI